MVNCALQNEQLAAALRPMPKRVRFRFNDATTATGAGEGLRAKVALGEMTAPTHRALASIEFAVVQAPVKAQRARAVEGAANDRECCLMATRAGILLLWELREQRAKGSNLTFQLAQTILGRE